MDLRVKGMHCASCVGAVEGALRRVEGVREARVNLATERATVAFAPGAPADLDEILRAVRAAGFDAAPADGAGAGAAAQSEEEAEEAREARRNLVLTIAAAAPAVVVMALMHRHERWAVLLSLGLATFVQVVPGATFYAGAARALRALTPNMDVLVSLGITAAYGSSVLATFGLLGWRGDVFFETSAMLVAFIRFGKWLEARARGRARRALRELVALEPQEALRIVPAGATERVPAADVRVGDLLAVRAGEKVPVDGEVVEGTTAIDESAVTGEPAPVEKAPGARVVGGTINRSGAFTMRATRVGADTMLAGIVRLVREAQADRPPIQRLADRVSAVFVPIVLALALATFAGWTLAGSGTLYAVKAATAVVVIACPCALGLATPTAILVGSGIGLKRGILVKKASALEEVARVDLVLFDKTGTLTRGRFAATDVAAAARADERLVLALAAAVERRSTHPLARAVVERAESAPDLEIPEPRAVHETGGRGVEGEVEGRRVIAGSRGFLESKDVEFEPALLERAGALAAAGRSLVFVARDGAALGAIALEDRLRYEAPDVVRALRGLGIEVGLVTGDGAAAARAVAGKAGIPEDLVFAEVLPEAKAEVVERRRAASRRVAFVGDGINDAPALARADVGIAMGGGTDVARETGDLVLVRGDLEDVGRAVRLGRATLRKIRQNLFFAFFYNVLGIPIAASGRLDPELAGLAMALSSVTVVTSSVMLRRVMSKL